MIIVDGRIYFEEQYDTESQFEDTVRDLQKELFGTNRIYFDIKTKIGDNGRVQNIPDGYLLDLSSKQLPKLFVVENELSIHGLKHIAMQLLEFSISYDSSKQKIKTVIRKEIMGDQEKLEQVEKYIKKNNFQNVDYLLDKALDIQRASEINIIVVIDRIDEDLEKALREKLRFPIEILTLVRYKSNKTFCFQFEQFMSDVVEATSDKNNYKIPLDIESVDTIVVPAQEEGFIETFIGENRWYSIRINSLMIPKIKYIAAYQGECLRRNTEVSNET